MWYTGFASSESFKTSQIYNLETFGLIIENSKQRYQLRFYIEVEFLPKIFVIDLNDLSEKIDPE